MTPPTPTSPPAPMRALTLRQPWAWAVTCGLKTTENRGGPLQRYRGLVAIHAGLAWSDGGARDPMVLAAWGWDGMPPGTPEQVQARIGAARGMAHSGQVAVPEDGEDTAGRALHRGAVVAVARIHDAHRVEDYCCPDPWAMRTHAGRPVTCHYQLRDVVALPRPVTTAGRQGVWQLPAAVDAAVRAQLGDAHVAA